MALPPISGLSGVTGSARTASEMSVGQLEGTPVAGGSGGFGGMLGNAVSSLDSTQKAAATASQQLATGTATDPSAVVMAVERARLSMQLASQLRTKGVEAMNDIFRTQV